MTQVKREETTEGLFYIANDQRQGPFTLTQEQDLNFDVDLAVKLNVQPKDVVITRIAPPTAEDLRNSFAKWLAIKEDIEVLDIIFAAVLDRRVVGDPLWLFVVGPPGSTKTEILRSLGSLPDVYQLSQLTSKTIVSDKEKKDGTVVRGIFPKINGKVVVISELSQILCKSRDERDAIFAQLRDLYDGHCVYGYGTLDTPIIVDCRIGLTCGVTSAIDMYGSVHAVLGDRFLKVRPKFNRDLARERAFENKERLVEMRAELEAVVKNFFQQMETTELPTFTEPQEHKINVYAEFVAQLRTTVTSQAFREYDTSEWQPEPEFATRLAQQFKKLAQSIAIIRGHHEISAEDMAAVSRVAMDTCLPNRLAIVRVLFQAAQPASITEISKQSKLPYGKTRNSLEALTIIGGIVEEIGAEKQHNERFYQLTDPFKVLMGKLTQANTMTTVFHLVQVASTNHVEDYSTKHYLTRLNRKRPTTMDKTVHFVRFLVVGGLVHRGGSICDFVAQNWRLMLVVHYLLL